MSHWYLEAVTPAHVGVLKKTAHFSDLTLVGGTALALQIGHRKSYDLDFVCSHAVTPSFIDAFLSAISPKELQQRLFSDTQYTAIVDGIKVTVFQDTAPLLHETSLLEASKLAAIADIFSTKLFVLGKRNAWRDQVDIACCLTQNLVTLKQGIKEAVHRYKVAEKWILEPLVYFDDIDIVPVEWIGPELPEDAIKAILHTQVEQLITAES